MLVFDSLMFLIGVKNNSWVLITNGVETYLAQSDVRHYSEAPSVRDRTGKNRISKLNLSQSELQDFCDHSGLCLRGAASTIEKCKKLIGPVALGGGLGGLIGGFAGAVIGAGLFGYFRAGSDFNDSNFKNIFERAKASVVSWSEAERFLQDHDQQKAKEEESFARRSWEKYYRLKNVESLDTLSGIEFELAIKEIYVNKGYEVTITPRSNDYGTDLIAVQGGHRIAIQAKRYSKQVGIKAVQEAATGAQYYQASEACVITNSFFSQNAVELAKVLGVSLIDRQKLMAMWVKVFPENSAPEFDMEKFQVKKEEIIKTLSQLKRLTPRHQRK